MAIAIALVLGESMAWWNPKAAWAAGILAGAGCCLCYAVRFRTVQKEQAGRRITLEWLLPACFLWGVFLWEGADQETEMECFFAQTKECRGTVQGTVSSVQTDAEGAKQITVTSAVLRIKDGATLQGRGVLIYLDGSDASVKIGNRIQAEGDLSAFSGASNPGQFDMKSYRKAQGIDAMMWGKTIDVLNDDTDWLKQAIWEFREQVKTKIKEMAPPKDAGLFCAIFLGDKSELDEEVKDLYEESGIAHIYAVSGTHVSILGALFYQFARRLTGSYAVSAGVGSLFLLLYAILVGNPVSAVRAILMFICYMAANIRGRIYDLVSALAISSIVILCWQPLQVTQCGFQLSFAAVFGIGMVGPAILGKGKKHGRWAETMAMALGVQFMIMPIQLYHFFVYPLYSFFLNLFILPAASLLLVSILAGAFLGFPIPFLGRFLLGTGHWILEYYEIMCKLSLELPMSVLTLGRPRTIQLVIYYLALFGFMAVREYSWQKKKSSMEWKKEPGNRRWSPEEVKICLAGLFCLGAGIIGLKRIPCETWMGQLTVTMLDVGQGDGFVIRLPDGSVIMIDGGSTSESQVGKYRLEPYLMYEGISKIDYVFLSHGDEDHVNGVQEILEHGKIPIDICVLPDEKNVQTDFASILQAAEKAGSTVRYLSAGMQLQKGEACLTCLHPDAGMQAEDINDTSQVLLLEMGEFRMLFTGDAGEKEETFSEQLAGVPITVLKVGHHGSRYSTGESLLENVQAKYAWISCGEGNRYGHPHEETVERLLRYGCRIYATPEHGAVKLKTDGKKVHLSAES